MTTRPLHVWSEQHPLVTRLLAVPVVLTFVLDLASKNTANMAEVLWSCYWASALIAIGLTINSELLVAAGFIFHAAVGGPAWTLGLIYRQRYGVDAGPAPHSPSTRGAAIRFELAGNLEGRSCNRLAGPSSFAVCQSALEK